MQDYEKLGSFYLGKEYDGDNRQILDNLILYDSRDLTTHALCVGMTGSGKTGLCVSLLEEAAIDGIPAIVIDPKGDLPNLMLRFPNLAGSDFLPWIDPGDATRAGKTPDVFAGDTAKLWRDGLANWGQAPDRIHRLCNACDMRIWTPGSSAGHQLSVLRSFSVPPKQVMEDAEILQGRIQALVGGILGLIGIEADIRTSREAVLLANILQRSWADGSDLDLASLIRRIQDPGFDTLGVLDLESMYPRKERFELAMQLNNLLASPGFATWREGAPLEIPRLLSAPDGRPRISIVSISHLSDEQRMFFVTLLLNEVIAWMRTQPGTGSLRAIVYMDEIMGYFPPSKNPPSKAPMLTLLKQARAFGVGIVLATQNPVDLDYKGLSNTGTWFIGRLQTERDKLRLMDGLSSAGGGIDPVKLEKQLSGLGKRVFLMHNIHEDEPVLFHTRWAMSYLRGPMTRPQIESLTNEQKAQDEQPLVAAKPVAQVITSQVTEKLVQANSEPPVLPEDIEQSYLSITEPVGSRDKIVYVPMLFGALNLHYALSRAGIDEWAATAFVAPLGDDVARDVWSDAHRLNSANPDCIQSPESGCTFGAIPADALNEDSYKTWIKQLASHAYRVADGFVLQHKDTKSYSILNADESSFSQQVRHLLREQRDIDIEKLRNKYAPKIASLESQILKAQQRVEREKAQVKQQGFQTALSVGSTILGALFGRKKASVSKATTALRGAGRVARESGDVGRAQESLEALQERLAEMEAEFEAQAAEMKSTEITPEFEKVTIRPRKGDISIQRFGVMWMPMKQTPIGRQPLARLETVTEG